jgi:hypothetical protein
MVTVPQRALNGSAGEVGVSKCRLGNSGDGVSGSESVAEREESVASVVNRRCKRPLAVCNGSGNGMPLTRTSSRKWW